MAIFNQIKLIFLAVFTLIVSCSPDTFEHITNTYPNGTIKEEYTILNSKKNGDFISYYPNGVIFSKGYFNDGIFEGNWLTYYPEGGLKSNVKYKKGKLININAWDKKGNHKLIEGNGTFIYYDPFDSTKVQISYQNNLPHGRWIVWYSNGSKMSECIYDEGKLHGSELVWEPNGRLKHKRFYQDGELIPD